jgi:deazaflavin-dependent oxidoreductase (nitroreductase family)
MGLVESVQSVFLRFHQAVYEGTRGRVGHRMIGVPSLLLTTVGRRSGAKRTAALVYARDGDSYIVVASNGGADRPPGWLYNLKAQPAVDVQVGTRHLSATAAPITPEQPEYARLWEAVNATNHGRYNGYQSRTQRPIELVRLTPG